MKLTALTLAAVLATTSAAADDSDDSTNKAVKLAHCLNKSNQMLLIIVQDMTGAYVYLKSLEQEDKRAINRAAAVGLRLRANTAKCERLAEEVL